MIQKYLVFAFFVLTVLCGLRFHDEEMWKSHHNHPYLSDDPITVYLMPHSHDDVGWLKTVDNYFYGGDQSTQWAGVQYTIDSVVSELAMNPTYKFSIVEMAFLYRWWNNANNTQKTLIQKHIDNGQLEIINAGWCMHDQATTYYQDIIDQMTIGLNWAKNTFGVIPTIGWHIDPFGHQSSNAALFSQLGFNAWFFSRMDYQDKQTRLSKKALQMIWHPQQYSGNDNYIFTQLIFHHYSPPPGFCFDAKCQDTPIKDDPTLQDYNLMERSQNLTSYFKSYATHYRSSNIFHTLGDDFHYSNARMWYLNFDKLIKNINSNSSYGVTIKYATPSEYISAVNKQNIVYPTKLDDFYPYADGAHQYWTGYFTSRVSLKSLVRQFGKYIQTVRKHISLLKLSGFSNYISSNANKIESGIWQAQMAQGIMQHHDAVAGTEKQKVANDYVMIVSKAYTALNNVYDEIRKEVINKQIGETPSTIFKTLWNTTYAEWGISDVLKNGNTVLLHLYNPGAANTYPIRIKVDNSASYFNVINSNGAKINGDLICANALNAKDCELIFNLEFKQSSYSYVKIKKLSSGGSVKVVSLQTISPTTVTKKLTITDTTSLTFTRAQNKLQISTGGNTFTITPSYSYYESYQNDGQKSGAYIFRPSNSTISGPKKYTNYINYYFAEGDTTTVFVYEGDKTYTKIYFSKIAQQIDTKGFEIETYVNSINVTDEQGKQIVLNLAHYINNNKTFYTDSNGLEEMKRIVDYRATWSYSVNEPASGNYYPINSHISVVGSSQANKLSVLVDRAEGGTAFREGFIELMIHRRTLKDDSRGVGQPLNQTEPNGSGLQQKVRHWVVYGQNTRLRQKVIDQPVVVTWSNANSDSFSKSQIADTIFPVPSDVKLFLRPYLNQTYLFRLHNFNTKQSRTVNIPNGFKVQETTLGGNQLLSQWKQKQMKWKDQPYTIFDEQTISKRANPQIKQNIDTADSLSLKPFQIRTFILKKQ